MISFSGTEGAFFFLGKIKYMIYYVTSGGQKEKFDGIFHHGHPLHTMI